MAFAPDQTAHGAMAEQLGDLAHISPLCDVAYRDGVNVGSSAGVVFGWGAGHELTPPRGFRLAVGEVGAFAFGRREPALMRPTAFCG